MADDDPAESPTPSQPGTPAAPPTPSTDPSNDPRLDPSFVRTIPATRSDGGEAERVESGTGEDAGESGMDDRVGTVHLVGVVHDHPASVHRARSVVLAADPAVLALELPPVAVPLFESYADDHRTPPAFGGEMSAAVQAAGDARVVGVDAPDRRFCRLLADRLRAERPPIGVLRRLCRGLLAVTRHALVCRLAATLAGRTGVRVEVEPRFAHDVTAADPPEAQAEDERRQVGRSRSLLRLASTPAVDIRDEVRETSVAAHLDDLRADGDVVAVLGFDHLDGVARRLRPDCG